MNKLATRRSEQRKAIYEAAIGQLKDGHTIDVKELLLTDGVTKNVYYRLFDDTDDMMRQLGLYVIERAHGLSLDASGQVNGSMVATYFDLNLGDARAVLAAVAVGLTSLKIQADAGIMSPGQFVSQAALSALHGRGRVLQ